MKERITITIEKNLVEKIDQERDLIKRSTFIEKIIKEWYDGRQR